MLRRASAVLGALVALGFAASAPAQEPPAVEPVTVDVAVGIEGFADPSAPLPVLVDLTATELIVGRIEVASGGGTTEATIEVPAGGAKRYAVTASAPGSRRTVAVNVFRTKGDGSDERIASTTARLRVPRDELLVGLFGVEGIETSLRSAVTSPVAREVVPLAMTPEMFEWESSVLSYVIAGGGAIADLDEDQRSAAERWVRDGGRLYGPAAAVSGVADPGGGVPWPEAGAVVARVGRGEVGAVDPTGMTVDQWSLLLRATPPLGLVRDQATEAVRFALVGAASAGRQASVPALPWLFAGIVLFVALVGPVNFVALRRLRRPELAWLTVPALSALFVAGFWLIGRAQLDDFTVTSASVVIDSDGRVEGEAAFLLQVESAGDHDLVFGEGWSAEAPPVGGGVVGEPFVGDDGLEGLTFELEDLGVGTALARWDARTPVPVSVTLAEREGKFDAAVVNGGDDDYWAWGLVVNGYAYLGADTLSGGGSGVLTVIPSSTRQIYEPIIAEAVNRRAFRFDGDGDRYGMVNALAAHVETELPDIRRAGVYFYGLTDQAAVPVEVDGRSASAAGPRLAVREIELGATDPLALVSVQPELLEVTGASSVEAYYEEIYAYGADQIYFLYSVPAGAPSTAEIEPTITSLRPEVYRWDTGEFESIAWGEAFDTTPFTSPGGDLVVRGVATAEDPFFDQEIRLSRYSLKWSAA